MEAERTRRVWRHSPKDALLLAFPLLQLAANGWIAWHWQALSRGEAVVAFAVTSLWMSFNVIVVSHTFTHSPWFVSRRLNSLTSMLLSVVAGQCTEEYRSFHVHNHHRYSNDRKGPDGTTRDLISTFLKGENGEHQGLLAYSLAPVPLDLLRLLWPQFTFWRLWRPGRGDELLLHLTKAHRRPQLTLDRVAMFLGTCVFIGISWRWWLTLYLPAWFVSLFLVNVQNYYEHYGARPEDKLANSVSHYGRIYNLLTFNDGFHQEHHLRPQTHWTQLPGVRERFLKDNGTRVVSAFPAVLGFLDRRPLLHRVSAPAEAAPTE